MFLNKDVNVLILQFNEIGFQDIKNFNFRTYRVKPDIMNYIILRI